MSSWHPSPTSVDHFANATISTYKRPDGSSQEKAHGMDWHGVVEDHFYPLQSSSSDLEAYDSRQVLQVPYGFERH